MAETLTTLPTVPTRAQIEALEQVMLRQPEEQHLHIEPVHYFSAGLYAREITIPSGALVTGKVHKKEHINIVSKGALTVWTEDGMKYIQAPFTFVSRPGTKRVGLAHEETVWTTLHANPDDILDIDQLEDQLVINTTPQLEEKTPCLSLP